MRPNLSRNNKKKIFNDPVYGFISIPNEIIFDLIQHPYFQRLRNIKQLGLTHLVYPGALHTRFHHALGAMHLMFNALQVLKRKEVEISEEEEIAVLCAILLHDIGHGPFSHTLEHEMVNNVTHENISSLFIEALAVEFPILKVSLEIFNNRHPKSFLYQLVSSQLDMDRLDYLNRDSFYTGVSEGIIGSQRIIEMLTVRDNQLLLEEKSIYSIEKFIVARRLMYWQVYLHKTVVAAEFMLIHIIRCAKELIAQGETLFASPALLYFLSNKVSNKDFIENQNALLQFSNLDDYDIMGAIKVWQSHPNKTLSSLSKKLVQRNLLKIEVSKSPYSDERKKAEIQKIMSQFGLTMEEAEYFVYSNKLVNSAYNHGKQNINLLMKNGTILDLSIASDNLNISALANPVEKYFLCYPG